ncbi:hypothetical protein [Bacillus phage SDFMU_Pbc]|uniref:Uncharacterized protein n=1 Tax=Bacillus phage SDFMU_Pbc TaxID=3076135 RepID=A0AA96KR67_9CAUD|nr:hypothetical protein [Bacillus phage SDFMU_Pbc]
MDSLKSVVYDQVRRLHDNDKHLEQDIKKTESELRAVEGKLARLKEEKRTNQEAVKESCETFGFVIGGYKSGSILDYESDLFYDEETAARAKEKTREEWERELLLGQENSVALAILRGDFK